LLLAPHGSYRTAAYCRAAGDLGIPLLVASEGEYSLVPEIAAGLHLDFNDAPAALRAVRAAHAAQPFQAVVATDDSTVELASRIGQALGLAHNPPAAARAARRKDLSRAALAAAGLPVPRFQRVDLDADPAIAGRTLGYPLVVKPLALSGSRGVIRVDDAAALRRALDVVRGVVADAHDPEERRFALAECYVPGDEIALEGMLAGGRLQVLAIFDKPDPLEGPYFEETYYVMPSRHSAGIQGRARARVEQACAALGLREGPVHAEMRLHQGDAWMLEVAARTIGGDCARLVRFGTGHGLEDLVLARALGRELAAAPPTGAAGVLMIPTPGRGALRRVEGLIEAGRVPGVEELVIAVREGYELIPLPEGSSYLGFIFARGPDPEFVEAALRQAHACLRVVLAPVWRLERGGPADTRASVS
jgi:biotin carboxylase